MFQRVLCNLFRCWSWVVRRDSHVMENDKIFLLASAKAKYHPSPLQTIWSILNIFRSINFHELATLCSIRRHHTFVCPTALEVTERRSHKRCELLDPQNRPRVLTDEAKEL